MTTNEIWINKDIWWNGKGDKKEGGKHGRNCTANCAICGKGSPIFYWTKTAKASKSELLHGIGYGTNDKSNELVKPPSTTTKN